MYVVYFPCRWNSKNPYALNQRLSYKALLRENILTDGTTQEFQVRVTSSDFNLGNRRGFFFLFVGWQAVINQP